MDTLIERFVCTNSRCYACGTIVYAVEKKMTTNHVYHNRCFRCRICKRNLTGSTLNEEGDDIYCGNCYRKKQRGDCSGLDFQRAASERAQYVHNDHHPDQLPPINTPRPAVRHHSLRHPSWTLHQLEREVLSHPDVNTNIYEKIEKSYQRLMSAPDQYTAETNLSAPIDPTKVRQNSSISTDESSPSLHFFPVFSPFPSPYPGSTTTPKSSQKFNGIKIHDEHVKPTTTSIRGNQAQSNQNNVKSPSTERKHSIIIDVHEKYPFIDKNQSVFFFPPDKPTTSMHRRSTSPNHSINRRKIK